MKPLLTRAAKLLLIAGALLGALSGAVPARAQSDVLKWGDNLPATLDPHAVYDVPSAFPRLNAYDSLLRYVGNPPDLKPWLAERYSGSADGKTWVFQLRHGVKFHDGSELSSDDVVYSVQRVLKLNKATAGAFKPILKPENVTATGPYEVTIQLDMPYAPFLSALPIISILNKKLVQAHEKDGDLGEGWLAGNDAGSGAYKFVAGSFKPVDSIDLEWFPDYFLGWQDKPIKSIKARMIKETSTRILAITKGEIDATDSYLPADQIERLKKVPGVRVEDDQTMRVFVIRMNNTHAPFNNLHFRRAMSYAFNYGGFIEKIKNNNAVRNPGPTPVTLWGAAKDIKGCDYDLEKAKAELALAKQDGVDIAKPFDIQPMSEFEESVQAAQLFQSDLTKIGLNARVAKNLWTNLSTAATKPDTAPDVWIHWVSAYFIDPENWIGQMYDSKFHGTWKASSFYKNEQVDSLLTRAREITAQDQRAKLYQEAERLIVADAPDIWVYNTIEQRALRTRVKGFQFTPVGSGVEARTMSLE